MASRIPRTNGRWHLARVFRESHSLIRRGLFIIRNSNDFVQVPEHVRGALDAQRVVDPVQEAVGAGAAELCFKSEVVNLAPMLAAFSNT